MFVCVSCKSYLSEWFTILTSECSLLNVSDGICTMCDIHDPWIVLNVFNDEIISFNSKSKCDNGVLNDALVCNGQLFTVECGHRAGMTTLSIATAGHDQCIHSNTVDV